MSFDPKRVHTLGDDKAGPLTTDRGTAIMKLMLLDQYQDSPNLLQYFGAYFKELDMLFEQLESVYVGRFLENAIGKQLDIIGVILGQSRGIPVDAIWFGFQDEPVGSPPDGIDGMATEASPQEGGVFRSDDQLGFDVTPLDDITYRSVLYAIAKVSNRDTCDLDLAYEVVTILLGRKHSVLLIRTPDSLVNPTPSQTIELDLSVLEASDAQVELLSYMSKYFVPTGITFTVNLI